MGQNEEKMSAQAKACSQEILDAVVGLSPHQGVFAISAALATIMAGIFQNGPRDAMMLALDDTMEFIRVTANHNFGKVETE